MTDTPEYTPPDVWVWEKGDIPTALCQYQPPIAGPTHDKPLPRGKHPLQLYSLATPNGQQSDDPAGGTAGRRSWRRGI